MRFRECIWHLRVLSNQQDEGGFVADEGFDAAQAYHDSARSQTISPKSSLSPQQQYYVAA